MSFSALTPHGKASWQAPGTDHIQCLSTKELQSSAHASHHQIILIAGLLATKAPHGLGTPVAYLLLLRLRLFYNNFAILQMLLFPSTGTRARISTCTPRSPDTSHFERNEKAPQTSIPNPFRAQGKELRNKKDGRGQEATREPHPPFLGRWGARQKPPMRRTKASPPPPTESSARSPLPPAPAPSQPVPVLVPVPVPLLSPRAGPGSPPVRPLHPQRCPPPPQPRRHLAPGRSGAPP